MDVGLREVVREDLAGVDLRVDDRLEDPLPLLLVFYWFCWLIWRALPYHLHRMKFVIGL